MSKLLLTVTKLGLDRFTAAQLDQDIDLGISQVGLTDTAFVVAPTVDRLPGEFRRLSTISGAQVGDGIVHMTIRDEADIDYSVRGFGLFLADGTLFAIYSQPERLFEKSPRATFLAAIDIAFPTGDVSELTFGDTDFLNPPATTTQKGVVRFATRAEVDAGTHTGAAVTPAGLRRTLPAGAITLWYGSAATVPTGWAICNGDPVARSDGGGMIVTPDLRDRVPVGAGGKRNAGEPFGVSERTVATSTDGAHGHGVTGATGRNTTGITLETASSNEVANGGSGSNLRSASLTDPGHTHPFTGNADQVAGHSHTATIDITQPSLALLFIMKV